MKRKTLDALGKPYRIFAEHLDQAAIDQFEAVMAHPAVVRGALMPDAHKGFTMPIGGVVAVEGMVFPSFVGADIGCGMCALPIPINAAAARAAGVEILKALHRNIPSGTTINDPSRPQKPGAMQYAYREPATPTRMDTADLTPEGRRIAETRKWSDARGSLGGGNHFLEIGEDESGQVWAIIHSGSRGVGKSIADHYMGLASPTGRPSEGCFGFLVESANGQAYRTDLAWCLEYALENRLEMMARTVEVLSAEVGLNGPVEWSRLINRHHNHAEQHAEGLWIHRKGATHAEDGMWGVIPGNMSDGSFIVRGKGHPDALWSSSHGAGRVRGRREAKERAVRRARAHAPAATGHGCVQAVHAGDYRLRLSVGPGRIQGRLQGHLRGHASNSRIWLRSSITRAPSWS